jgi:hypothetical protein
MVCRGAGDEARNTDIRSSLDSDLRSEPETAEFRSFASLILTLMVGIAVDGDHTKLVRPVMS